MEDWIIPIETRLVVWSIFYVLSVQHLRLFARKYQTIQYKYLPIRGDNSALSAYIESSSKLSKSNHWICFIFPFLHRCAAEICDAIINENWDREQNELHRRIAQSFDRNHEKRFRHFMKDSIIDDLCTNLSWAQDEKCHNVQSIIEKLRYAWAGVYFAGEEVYEVAWLVMLDSSRDGIKLQQHTVSTFYPGKRRRKEKHKLMATFCLYPFIRTRCLHRWYAFNHRFNTLIKHGSCQPSRHVYIAGCRRRGKWTECSVSAWLHPVWLEKK